VNRIETEFAGRRLTIETGKMAKQSAGSAVIRFGDTMVLAAVTVSPNVSALPFFPLTVEYKEKTYAAGKIPGGFIKREGRPSEKEILAGRLIDRSIRPLFPDGFRNEVQVFPVCGLTTGQAHELPERVPDRVHRIAEPDRGGAGSIGEIVAR
jgi:polyribonucleotide nucleotidyltransferase